MLIKVLKAGLGLLIIPFRVKVFRPEKIFKNKRIAIVGPADSAFDEENGDYIDGFDYIIRLNKALVTWNDENERYLGKRTEILFHNFHENMDTGGGGPINWGIYKNFGVKYLIQPRPDKIGFRLMFNYFKKYLDFKNNIYVLPRGFYNQIIRMFGRYHPTRGFYALSCALTSSCSEVFITGFTFFKTPYALGYRDNLRDMNANKEHLSNQGLHDADLEYANFIKLLSYAPQMKILVDKKLYAIIKNDSPDTLGRVSELNRTNS